MHFKGGLGFNFWLFGADFGMSRADVQLFGGRFGVDELSQRLKNGRGKVQKHWCCVTEGIGC